MKGNSFFENLTKKMLFAIVSPMMLLTSSLWIMLILNLDRKMSSHPDLDG